MISQYWKDQIPARPLSIQVKDQDGNDMNLSGYTTFTIKMLGSYNEELDLTGSSLNTLNKDIGKFTFTWPTTRSLCPNCSSNDSKCPKWKYKRN